MSSVNTRRTSSSLRSVSSISSGGTTGIRASTSLVAIFLGLALRVLLFFVLPRSPKLTYTLIGLWEGPILHHFVTSSSSNNYDPYVGFGVRLFVDFIVTEGDFPRLLLVCLWTGTGLVLADVSPELWNATGAKRSWHHLRRQLYILGSRMRRWSPKRIWKSKAPPIPRRPTTIRFDDVPSRHTPARTPALSEVTGATSITRDNVSILSGSSYSNTNSDSVSTFTPQSILTRVSSIYTRSYAPSILSNTNTGGPSSVQSRSRINAPSEDSDSDSDAESITPPASVDPRLRKMVPVPAFPGFFPDHFSETGTDFSVLPRDVSGEGTAHARLGALPSRKGKERANVDDDDDMYTSSGFSEDDRLTETEDTSSTPNAQNLQEIPDEPLLQIHSRNKKNMELDLQSNTSKEDELEKERQMDADIHPPASAAIPVIPDETRPQQGETEQNAAKASDAFDIDAEWTSIEKPDVPPPLPPKDEVAGPSRVATPPIPIPVPTATPPHSLRHKKSMNSLISFAPDVTIVPPSEAGETESMWGMPTSNDVLAGQTIHEEPHATTAQADPDAPEPPPRENPYNETNADAEMSRHTPPPTFEEALNSPVHGPDNSQSVAEQRPGDISAPAPSQPAPLIIIDRVEGTSDEPIIVSPTPPPSPPSTPGGRLSYILDLTQQQTQLLKDLHSLERQRKAALQEGPHGVALAISRKNEMRNVQKKLEHASEEVFLAQNPWVTTEIKPPAGKPFDLTGSAPEAGVTKLEEMLAHLIHDNAAQRRKSIAAFSLDGDLDASLGVSTLDKMSNKSLLVQVAGGNKGKPMKKQIIAMCNEQKLNFVEVPSKARQLMIMLPSLEDDK